MILFHFTLTLCCVRLLSCVVFLLCYIELHDIVHCYVVFLLFCIALYFVYIMLHSVAIY